MKPPAGPHASHLSNCPILLGVWNDGDVVTKLRELKFVERLLNLGFFGGFMVLGVWFFAEISPCTTMNNQKLVPQIVLYFGFSGGCIVLRTSFATCADFM